MTSEERIQHVALIIRENLLDAVQEHEEVYFDTAWAINRGPGWSFETSAPLGGTVRHEGVVLSMRDLVRAWSIAADRAPAGNHREQGPS